MKFYANTGRKRGSVWRSAFDVWRSAVHVLAEGPIGADHVGAKASMRA